MTIKQTLLDITDMQQTTMSYVETTMMTSRQCLNYPYQELQLHGSEV